MKQIKQWLLFSLVFPVMVHAQKREHELLALANPKADSIVLRWVPTSFLVWQLGNKYGYTIERFVVAREGQAVAYPQQEGVKLTAFPLRPMLEAQMEASAISNDKVAIVKEAIYSKDFQLTTPEKNLGNYITGQEENDVRFGFALLACDLSAAAADAAALRFVDRKARKGERYAYKISLVQQPKGLTIDPVIYVTSLSEEMKLPPPRELSIQFDDGLARLQWLSSLDKGIYTAYIVERATDGRNFKPVTDLPVISAGATHNQAFSYFTDSLADNETIYSYRIKGITPFAQEGPYSTIVTGQGKPLYERPFIDSVAVVDNKRLFLGWRLPTLLQEKTVAIIMTRALKAEGPYEDISKALPKGTQFYWEEKPLGTAYYRLKIKTTDGQVIYSLPQLGQLIDDTPPAIPIGLQGVIDSNGIVRLQWQANVENDLQGYRIFRANAAHEAFTEITTHILTGTSFTDKIAVQTLTPSVRYKVVAVDKVFNVSAYSPALILARPDKIAPAAPLFTYFRTIDTLSAIILKWQLSNSEDVERQLLYRTDKQAPSRNKQLLFQDTTNTVVQWMDTTAVLGHTYTYELVAVDAAGNQSAAQSGEVWFETGYRPAIKGFAAVIDRTKKEVKVEWKVVEGAAWYYLYRAANDGSLVLWKKLEGTKTAWIDEEIRLGNSYTYKIKAEWKNGNTTLISSPVSITY